MTYAIWQTNDKLLKKMQWKIKKRIFFYKKKENLKTNGWQNLNYKMNECKFTAKRM